MKIRNKLILWFLLISGLIVSVNGISFMMINESITQILEIESPKDQAILEMEINVNELGEDVFHYLDDSDPQTLIAIADARDDYLKWQRIFESLATLDEEHVLISEIDQLFSKYDNEITDLIDVHDKQFLLLDEFRVLLFEKFDPVIDDKLQKGLSPSDENFIKKQEALLEMEINGHEMISSTRDYVLVDNQNAKDIIVDSHNDFHYWKEQYHSYPLSETEKTLMEELSIDFEEIELKSNKIIELEDKKNILLVNFKENRYDLDEILDEQLQLVVTSNIAHDEKVVLDILNITSIVILGIIGVAVILAIIISNNITKPIVSLQNMTRKFSKGDFSVQLDAKGDNEIKSLIESFNSMAKGIKKTIELEKNLALQKQKVKNERLLAIGELAAGIAHDIRNPLYSIKNSTQIIKKRINDDVGKKEIVRINRSISRISHQILQVLDFVRTTPLDLEQLSLNQTLIQVIDLLEIPKNITITTPSQDFLITMDKTKMESVFYNIIFNAIQAIESNQGNITITSFQKEGKFIINFENDGPNIPDDILGKIFDALFTTKQKGTGLGLSGSLNSVTQHGGTISVQNNPVIFSILLPEQ